MEPYLAGSVLVSAVLGVAYYKGYLSSAYEWVDTRRKHAKLLLNLVDKIQHDISKRSSAPTFTVNETDTSATIVYNRMGTDYIVMIPYSRSYVVQMSQFKVELLRPDKEPLEITQQPGIPYTVSAESLGGHAIRITNHETGEVHHYSKDIIPFYGTEVMDLD